MFFRILKKDLMRKKGINIILFVFMLLSTVFVASSVNNILVVSNATNYCMTMGNVADEFIAAYEPGSGKINQWLKQEGVKYCDSYSVNPGIFISKSNITEFDGKAGDKYTIDNSIMLIKQWKDNLKVFDSNKEEFELGAGEIAMQQNELDNNNLDVGDKITLAFGNYEKTFTVKCAILDPAFGGEYIGMSRYVISDMDYEEIISNKESISLAYCFGIETDDTAAFMKEFNKNGFDVIVSIDKEMFKMSYVMTMITAGMLIVVGVCLIIIAFLILRFTIVFTLEEDYKQIGIMKAIGIRNLGIKQIYLVKYFALVFVAALLGCFISFPVSDVMLTSVTKSMMTEDGSSNIFVNILCSILVMVVVMGLCYLSANKLKKFTAIEAIRNGETGERFNRKTPLKLHKSRLSGVMSFLAGNDILSDIKKYIVLILTFAIGMVIIILPINTITTMGSDEMAKNFAIDIDADFFISSENIARDNSFVNLDTKYIDNDISTLKRDFSKKGYTLDINTLLFFSAPVYVENEDEVSANVVVEPYGSDGEYMELTKGTTPIEENEIAVSEMLMKDMGVEVGDTINVSVNDEFKPFVITGSYQNFMQMGKSMFVNSKVDIADKKLTALWYYQCRILGDASVKDVTKNMTEYDILSTNDIMNQQLGGTTSQLDGIKILVVILICFVNILITMLMVRIFVMGERGQIAMMRSIGFSLKSTRKHQVIRIGIILFISEVLGVGLSALLNNIALRPIFGMMGATHIKIQVNPLEVYLIYPAIILVITMFAAYIATTAIKKLNIMEINNME